MMIPSKYHVEVAAYNKLPKFISKPATLGVNEDPDCKPRSHWVAVFTDDCGWDYFFSSFGKMPKENIKQILNRNS